ncbi:MAG TPA: pyridoxamine 5'-phosphate oxidase family protein [Acidimicrobiales bacterium]|nr:pyridoxamine 5'-phosphate oxidase family protein [Acidimicrobiales bacterium]
MHHICEGSAVADLSLFAGLIPRDHGLCVVSTVRPDASVHSSVVNAGVMVHPLTGDQCIAFVAAGGSRKLAHLRADHRITIVARAGWQWAAVEGAAEIVGPDDPHREISADALRRMLRDIFRAAGGEHDDWDTYDRVMAEERRAAVLVKPSRSYSNPTG